MVVLVNWKAKGHRGLLKLSSGSGVSCLSRACFCTASSVLMRQLRQKVRPRGEHGWPGHVFLFAHVFVWWFFGESPFLSHTQIPYRFKRKVNCDISKCFPWMFIPRWYQDVPSDFCCKFSLAETNPNCVFSVRLDNVVPLPPCLRQASELGFVALNLIGGPLLGNSNVIIIVIVTVIGIIISILFNVIIILFNLQHLLKTLNSLLRLEVFSYIKFTTKHPFGSAGRVFILIY